MIRLASALVAVAVLLVLPAPVLAHGLVGRLESPLPLVVYLAGAATAVALSFAFVLLRDVDTSPPPPRQARAVPAALVLGLRAVGLIAWFWIVAQTLIGGSSDADVSSLFLWVYGWVVVALLSALVGPVWSWLDPFTTLYDLGAAVLGRIGLRGWDPAPYPAWLGAWPAVLGFAAVVWLELVYRGGSLGVFLVAYTLLTLVGMANFERDVWRRNGETFSVWFATLNRLAPFALVGEPEDGRVRRRSFASGLLEGGWTLPHVVLVALGTGSILYDGLSQTEPWFNLFGLPQIGPATVQLLGFLGLVVVVVLVVGRLVGTAALGAGLLPIAVGYLFAHYMTYVLGDGQRIVIALSDPLQLGWDLFGTAFYEPGTDWIPPESLWTLQLVAVIGGHMLGAWSGHVVASRSASSRTSLRLRQLPLAALMVVLTATTLWSLGQVVVDEPTDAAARALEMLSG